MEALYHQTNKMLQDVQNHLGRLEHASTPEINHQLDVELQARIDQIVSNCERLELLVNKEPPSRRATAKLRVDQLKYDCQHLQAAKRNVQHRRFPLPLIYSKEFRIILAKVSSFVVFFYG